MDKIGSRFWRYSVSEGIQPQNSEQGIMNVEEDKKYF